METNAETHSWKMYKNKGTFRMLSPKWEVSIIPLPQGTGNRGRGRKSLRAKRDEKPQESNFLNQQDECTYELRDRGSMKSAIIDLGQMGSQC